MLLGTEEGGGLAAGGGAGGGELLGLGLLDDVEEEVFEALAGLGDLEDGLLAVGTGALAVARLIMEFR